MARNEIFEAVKAGSLYFLSVFGAGFLFGCIRVPFLVPLLGRRYAELLEIPFMYLAVRKGSEFVVRTFGLQEKIGVRLIMGFTGLTLLLGAEQILGMMLFGRSSIFEDRDPVSGTAYFAMLGVCALMPLIRLQAMRESTG